MFNQNSQTFAVSFLGVFVGFFSKGEKVYVLSGDEDLAHTKYHIF